MRSILYIEYAGKKTSIVCIDTNQALTHMLLVYMMWQQNQEQWFKKWKAHAVEFTNSVTYKCIQFITNLEDIEYGSVIQKLTCEDCGMEPQYQEAFWEKYGQDAVHEAI